MATAYSTLLGLALPVQGELSGVWGDTVNNYITAYLDAAVAGAQTLSTDANVTLTKTTNASLNGTSSQYAIINCTGARTVLRTITAPAASKIYVVINQTTGGFGVKLVGSGPTTGVTVAAGDKALVAWNGSDFVKIASNPVALTTDVTGTLPVANGGTGAATLTANNVILGNGTSAVQAVAPGTSGNVLTSNGTTWSSTTPAAGVSLSAANTWTGKQTFNGTSSVFGVVLLDSAETVNVVAAAPAATTNLYVQSGSVQYYTSNAANNFIVNIAFSSGTTMNAALGVGQVETATLITTQNATAYYGTAVYIDGTATGVTTKWIGGAPTAGNASGLDTYRFAVIKTASATYTVLASLTQYK